MLRINGVRWQLLLLLVAVALLGGCIRETTEGSTRLFQNELWVPALALVGGVAGTIAGWFLRGRVERLAWGLMLLGPVSAIGFAPSLFLDRATVDDTGITLRAGIWGMTAVHDVKYDNLSQVRLIKEESYGRRGKKTNYYMLCEKKSGEPAKVPLGNQVAEAAAPLFLEGVNQRGIPITNETGE